MLYVYTVEHQLFYVTVKASGLATLCSVFQQRRSLLQVLSGQAFDMLLVRNGPYLKRAKHWWELQFSKCWWVEQVDGAGGDLLGNPPHHIVC